MGCGSLELSASDDSSASELDQGLGSMGVSCEPKNVLAYPGDVLQLRANVRGSSNKAVLWKARSGKINADAVYTAPNRLGRFSVTATALADGTSSASCSIQVIARPKVAAGPGKGAALSVHTSLGIPDYRAGGDSHRHLVAKEQYVLSYNAQRKVPNWVSWELNAVYFGGAIRSDGGWRSDSDLPSGTDQAYDSDYAKSGYDRGHLCAAADRSRTEEDNKSTFTLSNAVPQAHNVNTGPWQAFERYLQDEALMGREVFVVAGGVFSAHDAVIGRDVHVPGATWKVAVVLDLLSSRAPDVTQDTRVIAVMIENDDEAVDRQADWRDYRVSVRDVEQHTGFDLLSDVDADVQDAIEVLVDEAE